MNQRLCFSLKISISKLQLCKLGAGTAEAIAKAGAATWRNRRYASRDPDCCPVPDAGVASRMPRQRASPQCSQASCTKLSSDVLNLLTAATQRRSAAAAADRAGGWPAAKVWKKAFGQGPAICLQNVVHLITGLLLHRLTFRAAGTNSLPGAMPSLFKDACEPLIICRLRQWGRGWR